MLARAGHWLKMLERGLCWCWAVLSGLCLLGLAALLVLDWLHGLLASRWPQGLLETQLANAGPWGQLTMLYLLTFGGALAAARAEHLRVDTIERLLGPTLRPWYRRAVLLGASARCAGGWRARLGVNQQVSQFWLKKPGSDVPMRYASLALVLAMALMGLHFFLHVFTQHEVKPDPISFDKPSPPGAAP